jgi:hypothetical protein
LTIEIVGEFLGIDTDEGLYEHFRRHYGEWFPALKGVHRTTFLRQAANLWAVKKMLWKHLLNRIRFDPEVSLIDSSPVPVCHFARAYRCRRLAEESAFGYDEMNKQTFFYGLRAHLRVCWPGVVVGFSLAPANAHELSVAEGALEGAKGWVFSRQELLEPEPQRERLSEQGLDLLAPYKKEEVREGREEVVAALVGAQASPDRDGYLSAERALPGQESAGAGSLAPGKPLAAQGVESHRRRLPLPANRILLAVAFLGSPHRLKPAHRVSYTPPTSGAPAPMSAVPGSRRSLRS